jgi:hypothetical protein
MKIIYNDCVAFPAYVAPHILVVEIQGCLAIL